MGKKLTTKEFIEKAKFVHNNYYEYDNTIYKNTRTRILVTCPVHGDFEIMPQNHIKRQGCNKCGIISRAKKRKLTTEQFIKLSSIAHNNFYSYPNTKYINQKEKVEVLCSIHGAFMTYPTHHQRGTKCPECGKKKTREKVSKTTKIFVKELKEIFKNRYNLSKINYITAHTNVIIGCKTHGDILMRPNSLLRGQGCKHCAAENRENRGWKKSEWVDFCIANGYMYPSVYIINMLNKNESFIKIGISVDTKRRFGKMPYNITLLNKVKGEPEQIYNLEKKLHKLFKKYKYKPLTKFGGYTECFSTDILKDPDFQMFLKN